MSSSARPARPVASAVPTRGPSWRRCNARFAAELPLAAPGPFADGVTSWLDPHGLWSAASDAPTGPPPERRSERPARRHPHEPGKRDAVRSGRRDCRSLGRMGGRARRDVRESRERRRAGTCLQRAPRSSRRPPSSRTAMSHRASAHGSPPSSEAASAVQRRRSARRWLRSCARHASATCLRSSRRRGSASFSAAAVRSYIAAVDRTARGRRSTKNGRSTPTIRAFPTTTIACGGDMLRTALGVRIVDQPTAPARARRSRALDRRRADGRAQCRADRAARACGTA